jgi:hypothetical protein
VDDVERERDEQKENSRGLGDPGQECGEPGRGEDADGELALPRPGGVDHRERGGREPEHEDR